ncbi:hypothetical protein AURDEDRAFT_182551 [Auricularia subglabra TFB-10046 SS5]|nr:hypothetical protein AURDEDRAFT_182551 [Auricularia subglabra TFB-10046 SS5]
MLQIVIALYCVARQTTALAAPIYSQPTQSEAVVHAASVTSMFETLYVSQTSFARWLVLANCVLLMLVLLLYAWLAIDECARKSGRDTSQDRSNGVSYSDKGKSKAAPLDSPGYPGTEREMKTAVSDSTLASSSTGRTLVASTSTSVPSAPSSAQGLGLPFPLEARSPSADELARFGEAASPRLNGASQCGQKPRARKVALRAMRPTTLARSHASRSVPVASRRGLTSIQAEEHLASLHEPYAHLDDGNSPPAKESPLLPTWLPPTDSNTYAANMQDDSESSSDGSATECFPFEDTDAGARRPPSRFYAMHANTCIEDLHIAAAEKTGRKSFQPVMPPLRNSRRHAAFSKQIARDFGARLMTLQPVPASPSPHTSEDTDSSPGSPRKRSFLGSPPLSSIP